MLIYAAVRDTVSHIWWHKQPQFWAQSVFVDCYFAQTSTLSSCRPISRFVLHLCCTGMKKQICSNDIKEFTLKIITLINTRLHECKNQLTEKYVIICFSWSSRVLTKKTNSEGLILLSMWLFSSVHHMFCSQISVCGLNCRVKQKFTNRAEPLLHSGVILKVVILNAMFAEAHLLFLQWFCYCKSTRCVQSGLPLIHFEVEISMHIPFTLTNKTF